MDPPRPGLGQTLASTRTGANAAVALAQALSASLPYGAAVAMPRDFSPPQDRPTFPITSRDLKWRAAAALTHLLHVTTSPSKRLPAPDAAHFPGTSWFLCSDKVVLGLVYVCVCVSIFMSNHNAPRALLSSFPSGFCGQTASSVERTLTLRAPYLNVGHLAAACSSRTHTSFPPLLNPPLAISSTRRPGTQQESTARPGGASLSPFRRPTASTAPFGRRTFHCKLAVTQVRAWRKRRPHRLLPCISRLAN